MSLREKAEAANATDTDWPGVYTASYVSRRLTGQDDAGYREAEFIATFDPPTVLALLDVVEAADGLLTHYHGDFTAAFSAIQAALSRLPEEVR